MSEINPAPTSARTQGYDLARALAIFGMLVINFQLKLGDPSPSAGSFWAWASGLHSGRAAALFVTVAGAGVALMARGCEPMAVTRTLLLRGLFLFVAGNLLFTVWDFDILHFYAFYLALAGLLFIRLPRIGLLLAALATTIATVVVNSVFDLRGLGHGSDYWTFAGVGSNVFLTGIHPVLPWIGFLLVGMWIGRHDLTDPATRRRFLALGGALAVVSPLLSFGVEQLAIQGVLPREALRFAGVGHAPAPLYIVAGAGTSMFMIALCQMIVARIGANVVVRALMAAGQTALTIYVLHALVGVVIPQWLFDFGGLSLWQVLAYCVGFYAVVTVAAFFYRKRFSRGPLEYLMRGLSGATPRAFDPPPAFRRTGPGGLWAPVLGVALVGVIGLQAVGTNLAPGCPAERPIAANGVMGALSLTCGRRSFALELAERSDVTLETISNRDLYLELYDGDALLFENDDGGQRLNARLVATLEPGAYRVIVRPYHSDVGAFLLTREDHEPTVAELAEGEICTDTCASARDNECDDGGPGSLYAVCQLGSDCADCGVRTEADLAALLDDDGMMCLNTCAYANDGECDDGGEGSLYNVCAYGSDCGDCGPREALFSPVEAAHP